MAEAAIMIAGGVVSALGAIQQGKQDNAAAKLEAAQLNQAAGQQRAAGQREAIDATRQAQLVSSRALAVSAAGGGAMDGSLMDVMAGIDREGAFNAASAMFQREEAARGNEFSADVRRMEGKQEKKQSYFKAAGSLLQTAADVVPSLKSKYGQKAKTAPQAKTWSYM